MRTVEKINNYIDQICPHPSEAREERASKRAIQQGYFRGKDPLKTCRAKIQDERCKKIFRDRLIEALHTLPPEKAKVLELRYGVSSGRPESLEKVASAVGKSIEQVKALEASALRALGLIR